MTFEAKIALGNAAMQTPSEVADALRVLADCLDTLDTVETNDDDGNMTDVRWSTDAGLIRDTNGNTVGAWFAPGALGVDDDTGV